MADRQRAIQWRLAGEPIDSLCQRLQRPPSGFRKGWSREMLEGAQGWSELSRAPHAFLDRRPPPLDRLIVRVRRRWEAHAAPETCHPRLGAPTIQAEQKALQVVPRPSLRTVERALAQHGLTSPRLRPAPPLPPNGYPAPMADDRNRLHPVDRLGPVYLKDQHKRWYLYFRKDVFDGAIYAQ